MNNKTTIWTKSFILVVIVNALNGLALFITNPVFSIYLRNRGLAFGLTGIISSLLSWIAMCFRPFSGAMSDRLDKKKVLTIAYGLTAVCIVCYAFVSSVPAIIVVRVIHGIAFAISGTVSMAFATSFIPKNRIAEGISYLGVASLLSSMLGPQIGKTIFDLFGIELVFYVAATAGLLCLIIMPFIPYQSILKTSREKHKFRIEDFFAKELSAFVILIAILTLGNGIVSYYLVDFGESRGISNIALFFTVYSIGMLITKPFAGKIQDKYGLGTILYPAFSLYSIGVVLLAKAYSLTPVLVAALLKGIGQGNGTPAIQAESVKTLSPERYGVAISTCFIGQDIGNAVGPIYASMVVESLGYEKMFLIYAGILLVGLIFYVFISLNKKKENAI